MDKIPYSFRSFSDRVRLYGITHGLYLMRIMHLCTHIIYVLK